MKKIVFLFLLLVLGLAGCGDKTQPSNGMTRIVLTTGFGRDEVVRIENSSCSLAEIMVYLTNTKNQYENTFGEEIWNASYNGETLEGNIKDTVLARMARIKALNLLAAEYEIALEPNEKEQAKQAAQIIMLR